MKRVLAAVAPIVAVPVAIAALFAKTATAANLNIPGIAHRPAVVAQRFNDQDLQQLEQRRAARRLAASQREDLRRQEARREQIQREQAQKTWIPGHWEGAFLNRHWVEGQWHDR